MGFMRCVSFGAMGIRALVVVCAWLSFYFYLACFFCILLAMLLPDDE